MRTQQEALLENECAGQRNHIGWVIRAFQRLEHHRIRTGTSWFETKMEIIRVALRLYLSQTSPILLGLAQ